MLVEVAYVLWDAHICSHTTHAHLHYLIQYTYTWKYGARANL